jgi:hypothetical protein
VLPGRGTSSLAADLFGGFEFEEVITTPLSFARDWIPSGILATFVLPDFGIMEVNQQTFGLL